MGIPIGRNILFLLSCIRSTDRFLRWKRGWLNLLHGEALHLPVRRERRVAANANRQYGWKIDMQGCIFEFRIETSLASRWHLPRIDLQHPPIRYPAIIRPPYTHRHRYLRRQHIRCYRWGVIGPPCDIPFEIHRKKPIQTGRLRFTFNDTICRLCLQTEWLTSPATKSVRGIRLPRVYEKCTTGKPASFLQLVTNFCLLKEKYRDGVRCDYLRMTLNSLY